MSREIGEPGYFKMVKLVELGAKRNTGLGGGGALSGSGARWKYDEAIEALLVAGGEIDHTPRNHTPLGYGLLHIAAANGLVERVKFFLSRGASKELRANGGATPLHVACEKNHAAVVLTLLEAGASHETVDDKGRTPLHTAAAFGARFPVRMLLRNGASQTAEDENGVTPAARPRRLRGQARVRVEDSSTSTSEAFGRADARARVRGPGEYGLRKRGRFNRFAGVAACRKKRSRTTIRF